MKIKLQAVQRKILIPLGALKEGKNNQRNENVMKKKIKRVGEKEEPKYVYLKSLKRQIKTLDRQKIYNNLRKFSGIKRQPEPTY